MTEPLPPDTVPTTILDAPACELGEGPAYDPATDTAWWLDIVGRALVEFGLAAGTARRHPLPLMASMICLTADGRQLLAAEDGLYLREPSGALTRHLPLEADRPDTRSNDGRVHPSGALWIGTMGRHAEPGAGAIYHVASGRALRLYDGLSIPNAICFSADGATGHFTDTAVGILHRVPLDPATGLPVGPPVPLHDHRGEEGGLDGAVLDARGRIWTALWGAGRVDCHAPDGRPLRSVRVPARQPSCPAFVGPHLDRLLVTSAFQGQTEAARAADPHGGRTFLLDVGTTGLPEPAVRLD